MRILKILILCFCLLLFNSNLSKAKELFVADALSATKQNELPHVFDKIGNFFRRIFRRKSRVGTICPVEMVEKLDLSQTEVTAKCQLEGIIGKVVCADESNRIDVHAFTNQPSLEDMMVFGYKVSSGKIVGEGSKVVWDLSGVKAGEYTITATVEGCIGCGPYLTKTIVVIESGN